MLRTKSELEEKLQTAVTRIMGDFEAWSSSNGWHIIVREIYRPSLAIAEYSELNDLRKSCLDFKRLTESMLKIFAGVGEINSRVSVDKKVSNYINNALKICGELKTHIENLLPRQIPPDLLVEGMTPETLQKDLVEKLEAVSASIGKHQLQLWGQLAWSGVIRERGGRE